MHERGIEVAHVKKAILEPDITKCQTDGRMMAQKKIDKKRKIEVIYCTEKSSNKKTSDYLIITAYYLDN
jgi:hypothetical protein